jgi:hypothetical protein
MRTPTQIGQLKRILKAIAEPTTSWMSDPMIASSVMIHSVYATTFGYLRWPVGHAALRLASRIHDVAAP